MFLVQKHSLSDRHCHHPRADEISAYSCPSGANDGVCDSVSLRYDVVMEQDGFGCGDRVEMLVVLGLGWMCLRSVMGVGFVIDVS